MEDGFPQAFVDRVNREPGFSAELAKLAEVRAEGWTSPYKVLVDRISHEVPFYRFQLKAASLTGTYVINDPFWWSADEKFFGYSVAAKIGVAVPRTVMLPQKAYVPTIDPNRSLRNLVYPLEWEKIAAYVGFPAIMKPADGGGWKNVSRVNDMKELMAAYDASGTLVMTLQQFIDFEDYVRCLCIGKDAIRPVRYDPKQRRYLRDQKWMTPKLEHLVISGAQGLNRALGYDMNSVEFAVKDGVPYAIDFTNPAPDMYPHHIHEDNFAWCVEEMTRLVCRAASEGWQNNGGYYFQRHLAAAKPERA
jgi:hypothetical protein